MDWWHGRRRPAGRSPFAGRRHRGRLRGPGPAIRKRRTLPDDHSVGAVSWRGAGEVAGHAPARVVLPCPGPRDAPRPGSPSRPRRILLRPPSGSPRRGDGCRPPDHLGVVPDGGAGARRVTVDRRRARGLSGCRGRARAGPSRPFTGVAALSVRSGCAVRPRVPGRCPGHRRPGPTHWTVCCPPARLPACPRVCTPDRPSVRPHVPLSPCPPTHPRTTTHPPRRRTRIHPRQVKPSRTSARSKAVTCGTR